jgi:penicillin amidase
MKKLLKIAVFSVLFLLLGFFLFFFFLLYNSLAKTKGEVVLKGLRAEVEIIRDTWGVPHIFAQNEEDLFFACGYVHAQDRMWQMELTRRAGYGRLSEIFGERTLERDKYMRALGLKEAVQKDFANLTPELKELLRSYSKGINSWMNSRKFNWPPEFLILRYRPHPWGIKDSLVIKDIMALLLSVDYQSELTRAKLLKKVGPEKALQILEEGVELTSSPMKDGTLSDWLITSNSQGSNGWVLAGERTESGKPLLANDPHLEINLPSIWYEIHLHCPSLKVIGVSLPGIPLVIIGHNESMAWGITNSFADVQDLYFEKLNGSQDMYLDSEGWKSILKKEERIRVRGRKEAEIMEVLWTEQGPIISPHIVSSETPFSLRWTNYIGGRTPEAFYLLNKAQTWNDFIKALAMFDSPSQNFVYADKEGNIGYYLNGKIPRRSKEAALFPYPGWLKEGNWQGFLEEDKKPTLYNPPEGFIVNANNRIVSDGYPYYVSSNWLVPFRAERIKELVLQKDKHSVESLKEIQNDVFTKEGELFLPYILEMKVLEGDKEKAHEILCNWDSRMSSGKGAVLYKIFMNIFQEEIFRDDLGEDFESFNDHFKDREAGLLRIISEPLSSWFDKKETQALETREDIMKMSLEKAYDRLHKQYGSPDRWDWMRTNSILFKHSLGEVPLLRFFNRGPFFMEGDEHTVRVFFLTKANQYWGASFRQVIDLADFRNSVCVLTSGESGHFLSRHYDDQIPLWLEGQYHPSLFYLDDIKANAVESLTLRPLK